MRKIFTAAVVRMPDSFQGINPATGLIEKERVLHEPNLSGRTGRAQFGARLILGLGLQTARPALLNWGVEPVEGNARGICTMYMAAGDHNAGAAP